MDAYPGYREPAPARSPTERTGDDVYRERDRGVDRIDTFYRGRSPGMCISLFTSLTRLHKQEQRHYYLENYCITLSWTIVTCYYGLSQPQLSLENICQYLRPLPQEQIDAGLARLVIAHDLHQLSTATNQEDEVGEKIMTEQESVTEKTAGDPLLALPTLIDMCQAKILAVRLLR
jgi:hypothetical protein